MANVDNPGIGGDADTAPSGFAELQADLAALKAELAQISQTLASTARHGVESAASSAEVAASQVEAVATQAAKDVATWTEDKTEDIRETVRSQPLVACAIALGAGIIIGKLSR